ncbi:MAG: DUF2716 domain-containing protein [Acidobacteriota bacterium]|nr:DUF2716 domain-containing protein [Acidobacteriota bacterium]
MEAWELLSEIEYDEVWDRFYEQFDFKPSVYRRDFPGIKEPSSSITYEFDYPISPEIINDLETKTLSAFLSIVPAGDALYVLDWQHDCYWFRPHIPFREWEIPVLPNGDYYIFLDKDFRFGIFGHPWEKTICVWGEELLAAFEKNKPVLFEKIKRQH